MTVRMKAHFDGNAIVPDEPVNLPPGTPVTVEFSALHTLAAVGTLEDRLAALHQLASMALPGLKISDESLRRENLYEDR
jgi:hypothetical protein